MKWVGVRVCKEGGGWGGRMCKEEVGGGEGV